MPTRGEAARLLLERETRLAERSLAAFIRQAWRILEPARPLVWNWHLDCLCEHLEAVTAGTIQNLLINIPPGTSKSYVASVFWPAWEWTRTPEHRYLCASHDQTLSTRDNVRVRDLVQSEWYRRRWPVRLRLDQNQKTKFETTAGGWRIGTSVSGRAIGEHPTRKIIDDPHKPQETYSDLEIEGVVHWFTQTMSLRGLALKAATVIVMQRLHEGDLSGYVLENMPDFVHLCLPMKYEPGRMKTTPIGWSDPRTEPGELLWPVMFPAEVVEQAVSTRLGSWGEAAQYQQRPAPKGGAMFKRAWFPFIAVLPPDIDLACRFWDIAGTEGGTGARSAGVRMARTRRGQYIVTNIVKGRWGAGEVDDNVKQTADNDGLGTIVREEQEPGSAGKAVIASRLKALAGYDYAGVRTTGDKVTRAIPLRVQAEGGHVRLYVPAGDESAAAWAREFLAELEVFPHGKLKDQVDAAAGAFNEIALGAPVPSLDAGAEYPLFY